MIQLFRYAIEHSGEIKLLNGEFANSKGASNPSIVNCNEKYYISFRSCEYSFFNFYDKCLYDGKKLSWYPMHLYNDIALNFLSTNFICEFDKEKLEVRNPIEIMKGQFKRDNLYNGAEDIRLWVDDEGKLAANYSEFEPNNTVSMNFINFDEDLNVVKHKKCFVEQCEKNWMPISDKPCCFVRKAFDNITTLQNYDMLAHYGDIHAPLKFRGSSQLCRYKDSYICVVHTCRVYSNEDNATVYKYFHKFIQTDLDYNIMNESDWLVFTGMYIEFNCGMLIENDEMILPVSLFDSVSFAIKLKMEYVMNLIERKNSPKTEIVQQDELSNIILSSTEEDLPYKVDEYILNYADYNKAAAIACRTHLGSIEKDKDKRIMLYVKALCDVKKFDIQMDTRYMHMLIGQDVLRDHIDTFF